MTLAYFEITLSMSDRLSSLAADEEINGVVSVITAPPMRCMAVSKLMRVRVLGWKNREDMTFPSMILTMDLFHGSNAFARSNSP